MENSNYGGGNSEFTWEYSMLSGGHGGGMPYNPSSQMGGYGGGYGGRQWVHSNQGNTHQYQQQAMQQQASSDPYSSGVQDYNQSMMRYTSFPKGGEDKSSMYGGGIGQGQEQSMGGMGGMSSMSAMGGMGGGGYGGSQSYSSGMSHNGLGNPPQPQGNSGYNNSWF